MTPEEEISEHFRTHARNGKVGHHPSEPLLATLSNPIGEIVRSLPPGSRLTINIELPYEREYPHLHDGRDPEADE